MKRRWSLARRVHKCLQKLRLQKSNFCAWKGCFVVLLLFILWFMLSGIPSMRIFHRFSAAFFAQGNPWSRSGRRSREFSPKSLPEWCFRSTFFPTPFGKEIDYNIFGKASNHQLVAVLWFSLRETRRVGRAGAAGGSCPKGPCPRLVHLLCPLAEIPPLALLSSVSDLCAPFSGPSPNSLLLDCGFSLRKKNGLPPACLPVSSLSPLFLLCLGLCVGFGGAFVTWRHPRKKLMQRWSEGSQWKGESSGGTVRREGPTKSECPRHRPSVRSFGPEH